jgi:vancomycin resistance protein YoaR
MNLRPFRPSLLRVGIATAAVGVCAATAAVAQAHFLPDALTLPGLRLDGEAVPAFSSEKDLRAWIDARGEALRDRRVVLLLPEEASHLVDAGVADAGPADSATLGDFGVVVDADAVAVRLIAIGHAEDMLERATRARLAREGKLDVPLMPRVDDAIARARLMRLKEAHDQAPVSARLDLDHHGVVPEKEGRYVDADGTIAALVRAARETDLSEPATIVLPVATVPPRFTSQFVSTLDVSSVLAAYETYFSRRGDQARRGKNIDVAAAKLDGLVLTPGEMFSFNEIVGERSEENGFQKSWEILKGEMIEGIGGGTCQVASTLHAVAFFSGLDILERLPHSRPSAYIPMGLDATVVYPEVDMKLRNPFDFAVVLHAKVDGNRLQIELLGPTKPARVSFKRELLQTFKYSRKVEEDDTLTGNRVMVKQHGIRGYKIKRTRTLVFADGHVKKEETTDKYPPTTEIYEVPPGFDEALLPPLPEQDQDDGEGSDTSAAAASAAAAPVPATATASPDPNAPAPSVAPASVVPASVNAPVAPSDPSAVACTGSCAKAGDLVFVDAPGAHAPTQAQAKPPKTFTLRR